MQESFDESFDDRVRVNIVLGYSHAEAVNIERRKDAAAEIERLHKPEGKGDAPR